MRNSTFIKGARTLHSFDAFVFGIDLDIKVSNCNEMVHLRDDISLNAMSQPALFLLLQHLQVIIPLVPVSKSLRKVFFLLNSLLNLLLQFFDACSTKLTRSLSLTDGKELGPLASIYLEGA